jgi:hypothetical protein
MSAHRTRPAGFILLAGLLLTGLLPGAGGAARTRAPANLSVPSISGSAVEGGTFTASTGSWSGSPTSYAYAWRDCDSAGINCVAVTGATASRYSIRQSDVGHEMKVVVTAWNPYGDSTIRYDKRLRHCNNRHDAT